MSFFDSFMSFINTIVQMLTNLFASFITIFDFLINADNVVTRILGVMPPIISAAGIGFVLLSIVKIILGR